MYRHREDIHFNEYPTSLYPKNRETACRVPAGDTIPSPCPFPPPVPGMSTGDGRDAIRG